jgi:hypothetical protein
MKKLKFLLTALWIACFPIYFSSCEPSNPDDFEIPEKPEEPNTPDTPENPETPDTPENPETTIIGSWKLTKAIRQNSEGATEEWTMAIGQIWTFDENNTVSIENQVYEYTLSYGLLTTLYAETYSANHFSINDLSAENMTLSASHEEKDKVGRRIVTYTLIFARM